MRKPIIPENEPGRLYALEQYNILNSLPEKDYDDITRLAAAICETPVSLITLVDKDRQWFKSKTGLQVNETAREYAFCAHALNNPKEILIVPDSRKDERFFDNPLVVNDPYVIFYTGVPLFTNDGFALGSLCVIDHQPRQLSDAQLASLKALANQVMNLLELRKANLQLQKIQNDLELRNKELEQFAVVVSHDIKSPLSSIVLSSQMVKEDYGSQLDDEANNLLDISSRAALKIKGLVDGILDYYKGDAILREKQETVNLTELFESVIEFLIVKQECTINFPKTEVSIFVNKTVLEQVLLNLLNNSIKYNDKDKINIDISFKEDEKFYFFIVKDNGIGIDKAHREKIFTLFTTVGEKDRFGNYGSGIGLSTVKKLVESQGGAISLVSETGKGSTFSFSIQKILSSFNPGILP